MIRTKQIVIAVLTACLVICLSGFYVYGDESPESGENALAEEYSVNLSDAETDDIEEQEEHVHSAAEGNCLHVCESCGESLLIKTEAAAADFNQEGNTEYWTCSVCGTFFSDEEGNTVIEENSWIIPPIESDIFISDNAADETEPEIDDTETPSVGNPYDVIYYNGSWTYLGSDGNPDYTYFGIASNSNGTWLIANGKVMFSESGVVNGHDGNWYYVSNGKVQTDYTGIRPNSNGWWRIVKGVVDVNCNSVEQNENGWWYCKDGKVQFDYTGVKGNTNGLWRIVKGKVDFNATGVLSSEDGWWYIKNGRVQSEHNGIQPNSNGWWVIVNGKVDFNATGLYQNSNGWWYCKDGKVQFDYTGFKPNEYDWWRIVNGKVDFNATGVFSNENGWYYCEKGIVQFDYTGIKQNSNGWWRILNGKVDFNATGLFENSNGWWYCENGKVRFDYTGIKPNEYGWWRVVNGKVDQSATGVFSNENGWWYCKNGKVQFDYTGAATNSNGRWYIENGKVNFNKTGVVNMTVDGTTGNWVVRSGRVLGLEKDAEVLNLAAARLDAIGWNINSAYRWAVNLKYQHDQVGNTTTSNAVYTFKTSIGDCVGKASVFYWMAKMLGYDVKVIFGRVPLLRGGWSEHAWCEMYVNGKTYVVDPQFEYQERRNGFMIQYRQSGTWRYDSGVPMSD